MAEQRHGRLFWAGRPIDEMSRDELIEALTIAGGLYREVLSDLLARPRQVSPPPKADFVNALVAGVHALFVGG